MRIWPSVLHLRWQRWDLPANRPMKCDFSDTDDMHHSGRRVGKCARCGQLGLLPEGGWERLYSECIGLPRLHEWGGWLELILEAMFLTKHRWLWLKSKLGQNPTCGCEQRQEAMDTIGEACISSLSRTYLTTRPLASR